MELFRQEYELNLPRNWGQVTFDRLKRREEDLSKSSKNTLAKPLRVQSAIEAHPTITGPLDASSTLHDLTEDEQCMFFTAFPKCKSLLLNNWSSISAKTLRCISMTLGEELIEIDLSNSLVNSSHLEILLIQSEKIKVLKFSNCPNFDGPCVSIIAKLTASTATELYLNNCPHMKEDPLLRIGGCIGLNAPKFSKLNVLDLSGSPITNKGLAGVSKGCRKLQFLNLKDCNQLTDKGLVPFIKANKNLKTISLAGCLQITNVSIAAIASHCLSLVSLNIAQCSQVNDIGIIALGNSCHDIQTINLAGLLHLSENAMYSLSQNCKGLLMMNITGCSNITINGLQALITGLKYVEPGISFFGFKPIDKHIEKKLNGHLQMLYRDVIKKIEEEQTRKQKIEDEYNRKLESHQNKAATFIQRRMYAYSRRMYFYRLWKARTFRESVALIQRIFRGFRGRRKVKKRKADKIYFLSLSVYAIKLERVVRGHLARQNNPNIFKAIRDMYTNRRMEAYTAVVVRLQCFARLFLARERVKAWRELVIRKRLNRENTIIIIQMIARIYNAKMKVAKIRYMKMRREGLELRSAARIKRFYRESMERYYSKLDGAALQKVMRAKWRCTLLLQRSYRGFRGREKFKKLLIAKAVLHKSAVTIQRIYRGACILHWRDLRLNFIAAFVLDRQYLERKNSIAASRLIYRRFVEDNQRDSASDVDDEEEIRPKWIERYDDKRKRKYWENELTKNIVFEEPDVPLEQEKAMIGMRVRIYWVVQRQWFEGTISQYHIRKHRHRIEYDDGDHEWIHLDSEQDRIQVQTDDGSWLLYQMFESAAVTNANRRMKDKRQQDDFKKQAYTDALQWKVISNEKSDHVMFISQENGEMRMGQPDAHDWIIQDDGYGFPCFFNIVTNATKYEDPRFIHDVDDDVNAQRSYCMQELRYALYFCKDYWDKYTTALEEKDETQQKWIIMTICNSSKPKHLTSFLIRAKILFQSSSVVDQPLHVTVHQEIEYATWISARMADLLMKGEELKRNRKVEKSAMVKKLTAKKKEKLLCIYCERETKRHLEFCATCGKQQVTFKHVPIE